ncbi:MAG: hypothetical protein ACI94Y_001919 [Maribacter sp.]|jgi:hypothetical protein
MVANLLGIIFFTNEKLNQLMKLQLIFILCLAFSFSACALLTQQPKSQIINNINTWYDSHPEKYSLIIKGKTASAKVSRYHPDRTDEKNDLIKISYKGMKVILKFTKPLDEISTDKDSLQKYISYLSLTNIYNEIPSKGWDVYPETPQSSLRGKGVEFTSGGDSISLNINWSIYTVMGYKNTKICTKERSISDSSISEKCYVAVNKRIPLEILITGLVIEPY